MPIILSKRAGGGGGSSAPSGPAGGSLAGTYPNPTIAAGAVDTAELANDAVESAQIAAGAVGADELASGIGVMTTLFDSTLGVDGATIDTGANGIAQTAEHLLIIMYLRTDVAAALVNARMRLNNDSGANYDYTRIRNTNSTVTGASSAAGSEFGIPTPGTSIDANYFAAVRIHIPNYVSAAGNVTMIGETNILSSDVAECVWQGFSGIWRSSAAVTRLGLSLASGNYVAGSRLSIYGIG